MMYYYKKKLANQIHKQQNVNKAFNSEKKHKLKIYKHGNENCNGTLV